MLGLIQIPHHTWLWCLDPVDHSQSTGSNFHSHSAETRIQMWFLLPLLECSRYLRRAFLQLKPDNILIIILAAATHHSWIPENSCHLFSETDISGTLLRAPKLDCLQIVPSLVLVWWHKCQMGCHLPSAFAAAHPDIYQIGQLKRRTFSDGQRRRVESLFLVFGSCWPL